MFDRDYVLMIALIALSVLTSFFCTFYGVSVVMGGQSLQGTMVFAYVSLAYGLANLAILSLAWSSREQWAVTLSKLFALIFLGIFVMDAVRNGVPGGIAVILVLALIVFGNWYAIKTVVNRP